MSWSTQNSGRLNVVMPIDILPDVVWSVSKAQTASSRVNVPSPASRSNQYQPPSMNGFSGRSNTSVCSLVGVHGSGVGALDVTLGGGAVDDDGAGSRHGHHQPHAAELGPAPPVARRESVEVRSERQPPLRLDHRADEAGDAAVAADRLDADGGLLGFGGGLGRRLILAGAGLPGRALT